MTPDKLREKPNTVRLCSGVQVVNGITGETGPTFSEYVLLSDYEELQRAHAAALEEIERLNAAWKAQHAAWKAQQFHLEAEERESAHWKERAEKAERRAERLKGHAEAMADAIQFGDLAILTVAKAAAESYRASFPKAIQ